jgi:BACON domain-containing protein/6-bladed beta-propeller protein
LYTLLSYSLNNRLVSILSLVVLFILLPSSANATLIPVFERLAPLTAGVTSPTIVTLDMDGQVYVAETVNNRVLVFSQSGSHINTITGLAGPISLAVDGDGRIYIGNLDRGNVEVYDASSEHLFNLGQGNGEFGKPNDIDIDASGFIYVIDNTNSTIRIYNPDGTYNTSIGQPGNGDGEFYHPLSLTMDFATNELVVLDLQQQSDISGTLINGARIQFLEMNGTFKRGYVKFGYDMDNGDLVMPKHIAVDDDSRVYVSDSRLQKVMVYENNGDFLGMIDSPQNPLRTPLGIAMGLTSKLYVASLLDGRVEVYGLGSYVSYTVSPAAINFDELQYEPSGELKPIAINNTGNSEFTWTATTEKSWITLSESDGLLPPSGNATVSVGIAMGGLDAGQYQGMVTITAGMAAAETVIIDLTVWPNETAPELSVTPESLTFSSTVGITPADQILFIENTGGALLSWNANVDQSWLMLKETSGTAPSELEVSADITLLAAGSYNATVTITSQGAPSEMKIIPVSLTLTEPYEPPAEPSPGGGTGNKKWTITRILPDISLNGVWGSSSASVFVVGAEGSLLQYDGRSWTEEDSGVTGDLYGIWGSSAEDVYVVGESGLMLHYDGSSWSTLPAVVQETLRDSWGNSAADIYAVSQTGSVVELYSSTMDTGLGLRSIWGSSGSDIFVAGENGTILHYDGSAWAFMDSETTLWLNGVWGCSDSDVFAVGENGAIVHYNGTSWSSMDSGTTLTLHSVWGSSCNDVYAVGANGLLLYYNGVDWYEAGTDVTVDLNDVWVSSKSEVIAVGEDGVILFGKAGFPWILFRAVLINTAVRREQMNDISKE